MNLCACPSCLAQHPERRAAVTRERDELAARFRGEPRAAAPVRPASTRTPRDGLTLDQVALEVGVSPGHVYRIEVGALRKLRVALVAAGVSGEAA